MKFGIYVHIPYCLQICSYCDFAKFEVGKIPDQAHYTQLLLTEIRQKQQSVPKRPLTSIYFGGGTPSLMSEDQFTLIIGEIKKFFNPAPNLEITIEINPGNLSEQKLVRLLELGVNRFSVGSQTFNDSLLKDIGRKHSSKRRPLRMKNAVLHHEFVEFMPTDLAAGVLYVSIPFATAAHLCCCGCGNRVITPLTPTDWKLTYDGEAVSLSPSIGNWSFPCKSHYWVKRGKIKWAGRWSPEEVAAGRSKDRLAKKLQFEGVYVSSVDEEMPALMAPLPIKRSDGFWNRLWRKLTSKNIDD